MINKVTLLGRLGKDPEVRHFDNDSSVCNFTLATSESYKGKDGNRVEQTEWHSVAIWRNGLVGVAEKYLKKGSLIYAEGKLRTRSWDDKDGNKRYTTEVVVDNFKMLDGKPSDGGGQSSSAPKTADAPASTSDDVSDDLPF